MRKKDHSNAFKDRTSLCLLSKDKQPWWS